MSQITIHGEDYTICHTYDHRTAVVVWDTGKTTRFVTDRRATGLYQARQYVKAVQQERKIQCSTLTLTPSAAMPSE